MNDLIDSIFGDAFITLQCQGGECLHYSQVPGYVVRYTFLKFLPHNLILFESLQRPLKPDNAGWVALSAASAGLIVVIASAGKIVPSFHKFPFS